jgi:hypothetical protein
LQATVDAYKATFCPFFCGGSGVFLLLTLHIPKRGMKRPLVFCWTVTREKWLF